MAMKQYSFDDSLLAEIDPQTAVAGVDEVGRGALFGPVVAATVLLPVANISRLIGSGVRDSKKLSAKQRQGLVEPIKKTVTSWCISYSSVVEIDRLNILQASLLAMKRSIMGLPTIPDLCLVDGNLLIPQLNIPQKTVVKGDLRSPVIAAASILAKVWRDELVISLAETYPEYGLAANKGYPTTAHRLAIQKYGISLQHRRSFKSCRSFSAK